MWSFRKTDLKESISICIVNGDRLLDDSYALEFRKPPSSRYYLVMIAQEELAKAFILLLILENVIPFDTAVANALRDHKCKHLVGMLMDYVILHWEEFEELEKAVALDSSLGDRLPNDVGSAAEILRFEMIGRLKTGFVATPPYDLSAVEIAKGKKQRRNQDAMYVDIGGDGKVISTPSLITEAETSEELERARRYLRLVEAVLSGTEQSYRFEKLLNVLRQIFAPIVDTRTPSPHR